MTAKNKNITMLFGYFSKAGGTERATIGLANNFAAHGKNVTIVSVHSTPGTEPFFLLDDRVEVIHLGIPMYENLGKRILNGFPRIYNKIKNIVMERGGTVIGTVPYLNFMTAILRTLTRKKGVKYVACQHVSPVFISEKSVKVSKLFYNFLDAVVVLSKADSNFYQSRGIRNIVVIPNEIPFYPESSAALDSKKIIAIGRLTDVKQFGYMIESVAKLMKEHTEWVLEITGDGELKGDIEEKIAQMELQGRVLIKPFNANIIDTYLHGSIYLLTSKSEAFPMVLLEAQACGLPIVAHDCPSGPAEIVNDGVDGFLPPLNDVSRLNESLSKLIKDEELRTKMGKAARKNVLRFSTENIYDKWQVLFNELNSSTQK